MGVANSIPVCKDDASIVRLAAKVKLDNTWSSFSSVNGEPKLCRIFVSSAKEAMQRESLDRSR